MTKDDDNNQRRSEQMSKVELFGFPQSTYVRTARLVCAEKDVEYTLVPLKFRDESHRALHPYLKMPVMRHGDFVLFESLAIAIYLNDNFAGPDLVAKSLTERAQTFQWICASSDYIYSGIVQALATSESIDPNFVEQAIPLLLPFDRALRNRDYLVGDELSLADLFLLPMLLFADQALEGVNWLSSAPHVAEWLNRLANRPSVTCSES
jgi:glutathione S-transferase